MKAAAQPGDVFGGRYQVVRIIGRGTMADVFEATDRETGAPVALKVLRAETSRDPETVKRFRYEADVQRRIEHRNVARLFDAGVLDRHPWVAMELLRGRSLLTVLRKEGPVDVIRAASYAWQSLQGLEAVHRAGILHRDLKPANLMLEPSPGPVDRVVVIDFGFAALGAATGLTQRGHVVGTLSYIAPERLRGEEVDSRADLYAVGVILFELLVGKPPFVADSDLAVITSHLDTTPPVPSEAAPDRGIPPGLDEVILRALAKRPAERYPSAAAMAAALDAAVQA